MTTRRGKLRLAFVLLLASSLFWLGGCGSNPATTNETSEFDADGALNNLLAAEIIRQQYEQGAPARSSGSDYDDGADSATPPPYLRASASADYDADGFTITVDFGFDDLQAEFEFSKKAVRTQTANILNSTGGLITITGEAVYCNGSYTFFYEFGPHGLAFDEPVTMSQTVDGSSFVPMGLFYNVQDFWYTLEEVGFVKNGSVDFNIWHFSKYGVSR